MWSAREFGLRLRARSALIVHLPEAFVAQGERGIVLRKSPLGQFQRRLADAQGFGEAATGAQCLQLVLQDTPEIFFAFHTLPAFT